MSHILSITLVLIFVSCSHPEVRVDQRSPASAEGISHLERMEQLEEMVQEELQKSWRDNSDYYFALAGLHRFIDTSKRFAIEEPTLEMKTAAIESSLRITKLYRFSDTYFPEGFREARFKALHVLIERLCTDTEEESEQWAETYLKHPNNTSATDLSKHWLRTNEVLVVANELLQCRKEAALMLLAKQKVAEVEAAVKKSGVLFSLFRVKILVPPSPKELFLSEVKMRAESL